MANETKKGESIYRHSEDYLNDLGYVLMENGELEKSLEVFKLNVYLFPNNWNVYDSYGEALLNLNKKVEAIKMYNKSIELNPNNENAKTVLEKLNKK